MSIYNRHNLDKYKGLVDTFYFIIVVTESVGDREPSFVSRKFCMILSCK